MSAPDAVVVGGGVIGLSIAWRSAQRGLEVVVVDDAPGRGASWAAAGMLAPASEVHPGEERLLALALESSRRYPRYVADVEEASGRDAGLRLCGTLLVARDADENASLEELFSLQQELGVEVQRLTGRECRALEPALTPRTRGGVLVPGDHQVDNRALVEALLAACGRTGVELRRGRAAEVTSDARGVTGVVLADGDELRTRRVVLCAGCWSGAIAGIPPGAAPVRPVKGQVLHLRASHDPPLISRSVRAAGSVYVVPRADGRIVVGATVEEQGFDTRITAGAVLTLLREAYEILPGLAEVELTETAVGLRPGSPDNAPLLGPTGLPGLHVATGHYRNGILLAPVTADAIAELLVAGELPEAIAPFSPERFAPGRSLVG